MLNTKVLVVFKIYYNEDKLVYYRGSQKVMMK